MPVASFVTTNRLKLKIYSFCCGTDKCCSGFRTDRSRSTVSSLFSCLAFWYNFVFYMYSFSAFDTYVLPLWRVVVVSRQHFQILAEFPPGSLSVGVLIQLRSSGFCTWGYRCSLVQRHVLLSRRLQRGDSCFCHINVSGLYIERIRYATISSHVFRYDFGGDEPISIPLLQPRTVHGLYSRLFYEEPGLLPACDGCRWPRWEGRLLRPNL